VPHIIVEYSEQLFETSEVQSMLQTIHQSIVRSRLFDDSHIKIRAYPFKEYSNAGEKNPYIHVQARIKSGRDVDNKKRLSQEILIGLKTLNLRASVVTVEIIDMDRDSYSKYIPK